MVNDSTVLEKEIISTDWKVSGGFLIRKLVSKGGIREKKLPLYLGEHE